MEMKDEPCIIKFTNHNDFIRLDDFYKKYSSGGMARFTLKKWFDEKDPEGRPIFTLNNNEIIGAGYVRICSPKFALFTSWLVHPSWRNKGVASAMDKFAFDFLKQRDIEKATLAVDVKNPRSLNRLYYLQKTKKIYLGKIGSVFFVYASNDVLNFPEYSTNTRYATAEDEFESWWFLRLSLNFYRSCKMYGEDRNFHFLDRKHLKKLIENKRVFITKGRFCIKGLVIINPESLISDKSNENIAEICFAYGAFEPIIGFISNQYQKKIRAYVFSAGDLKKFFKIGFLPNHTDNPDLNMRIHKIFSYRIKNNGF